MMMVLALSPFALFFAFFASRTMQPIVFWLHLKPSSIISWTNFFLVYSSQFSWKNKFNNNNNNNTGDNFLSLCLFSFNPQIKTKRICNCSIRDRINRISTIHSTFQSILEQQWNWLERSRQLLRENKLRFESIGIHKWSLFGDAIFFYSTYRYKLTINVFK